MSRYASPPRRVLGTTPVLVATLNRRESPRAVARPESPSKSMPVTTPAVGSQTSAYPSWTTRTVAVTSRPGPLAAMWLPTRRKVAASSAPVPPVPAPAAELPAATFPAPQTEPSKVSRVASRTGVPSGRPSTSNSVLSNSSDAFGSVYLRNPASGLGNWLTSNGGSSAVRHTVRSASSDPGRCGPTNIPPTTATASRTATVVARVRRPPPS